VKEQANGRGSEASERGDSGPARGRLGAHEWRGLLAIPILLAGRGFIVFLFRDQIRGGLAWMPGPLFELVLTLTRPLEYVVAILLIFAAIALLDAIDQAREITIFQFFEHLNTSVGVTPAARPEMPRYLGPALIGAGTIGSFIEIWQYRARSVISGIGSSHPSPGSRTSRGTRRCWRSRSS
jgi:hypothetical protein